MFHLFSSPQSAHSSGKAGPLSRRLSFEVVELRNLLAADPWNLPSALYWQPTANSLVWDTGTQGTLNWSTKSNGSGSNVGWSNGADAIFQPLPDNTANNLQSVAIDNSKATNSPISANTITFMSGLSYAIGGQTSSDNLVIPGSGTTIEVQAGATASITCPVQGSGGITQNVAAAGSTGLGYSGELTLSGDNTYTGATTVGGGTLVVGPGGSLGNTAITVLRGATFAPRTGGGSITAGTTGAGTAGASLVLNAGSTFDMTDGSIGTFDLQRESGFNGQALVIDGATLGFALSSAGADQLAVSGAADVSGVNVIDIATIGTSLAGGSHTYDLITAANGLSGTFQFANGTTQTTVAVGSQTYRLALGNFGTAETLTVDDAAPFPVQAPPLIQTATVNYVDGTLPASTIDITWSEDTSAPANYTAPPASACFSTPASTVFGQIVVFGATVAPGDTGGPAPTGWVDFYDGNTKLDSELLDSSGYAAFRTAALGVGSHTIKAVYSGDANDAPGMPATVSVTVVNNAPTYYVDPSGSDSNSGTSASQPFQTLAKAFETLYQNNQDSYDLTQGATIYLAGGTYDPNLTSIGSNSWSAGSFTGAPGHPITIAPAPGNTSSVIWDNSAQGLTWTYSTAYGGCWEANLSGNPVADWNVSVFGPNGDLAIATFGSISQVTVDPGCGGSGYKVNDILTVPSYSGNPGDGIVRVTAVDANGAVTGVAVPAPGDPIYSDPDYSGYKNRDGYFASTDGYQWSTQAVEGSQGPSSQGTGCTLDIQAVTPITFNGPQTVPGLTDSNGNLLHAITWFDGTTLYFKPSSGESVAVDNQGRLASGQLHVVSSALQNYFGGYTTLLGITIQDVEFGIHASAADSLAIEGDRFACCGQGVLFGGANSLFQNNYIDMIGADYEWENWYQGGGYWEGGYDHSLYLSGSNLTVNNNFSGQAPGLGLKGNDVDNSLFENNVVSDTESWFVGTGNRITGLIAAAVPSSNGFGIDFIDQWGQNQIDHNYLEAADPIYSADPYQSLPSSGLSIANNTLNTLDYGRSLDIVGNQEQGSIVAGNTYVGSSKWLVSNGDQIVDTSNFADYVSGMQTVFNSDWDSPPASQVGGAVGGFDMNGLFAEMDSNPSWLGAPDVLRAYAAKEIEAAGGTPVTEGTLTPPDATEGLAFTQSVFHFCDADPNSSAADYTAVVTLGDGNTATLSGTAGSNGQIVADAAGGFDVVLSYTYATSIQATAGQTFGVVVTNNSDGATTGASVNSFAVRATLRWGGGSGNWTDTNWYDGNSAVPEAWIPGSDAVFPSTADSTFDVHPGAASAIAIGNTPAVLLNGPVTVNSIDFEASCTIEGGSLSLLAANTTVNVEPAATVTLASTITGGGGLIMTGGGTMILSGANNDYVGATEIESGTLVAAGGSAIPDLSAVVLANTAGATLGLAANATIGSLSGGGASGGNVSLGGNTLTVGTDGTSTTFAGVISGTGSLIKDGSGTMVISGPNTYTGNTTITGGTLSIGNDFALGHFGNSNSVANSILSIGNGELDLNGHSIMVGELNGYNCDITDDSQGPGVSVLTTTAGSLYQGTIQDGPNGRKVGFAVTSGSNYFDADNTYSGGTSIASGAALYVGRYDAASIEGNVTDNGSLCFCSTENITMSGVISGSGSVLLYPNTGALILSGANTYTGQTVIYGGTLIASNLVVSNGASNLGNATSPVLLRSDPGEANGVLQYTGNESVPFTRGFEVFGDTGSIGEIDCAAGSALAIASGAVAINDYQLVIGGNGNIMISSVISGAGSLVKTGAGTLTLEGDNTYTGGTIIASGSLSIQDAGAVPTGTGLVVGEGAVSLFAAIESAASDSTVATAASPSGISAAQPVTGAQTTLATADTVAMTTASTALAAPLSKIAPPVGNTIRGAPILPVAVASNEVSPAAARADYFSRQAAILSYQAPGSDVAASLAPRSASGISVPVASVVRPPKLDDVRRLFPTAAVREQVHVAALQSYHVLPSGEWAAAFVLWDLDNVSPNSQSRNRNHHFDLEQFLGPGNTEGQ